MRSFWEAEAREIGGTPLVTIRDLFFRLHELHTLLAVLPQGGRLLDAGCGTGFGTLLLARRAQHAVGLDSSPAMLDWARRLTTDAAFRDRIAETFSPWWALPGGDAPRVEFVQGDVLDPSLAFAPFDVVATQRLLINLPTTGDQRSALHNLRRLASDAATLVAVETTEQGYQRTDAYRALFGLPPLERHWHNLYLDERDLPEWKDAGWRVEAVLGFETYLFLSKVVYPAACGPERCQFVSGPNRAAAEIACAFRTRAAAEEIGPERLLALYVERTRAYEPASADRISAWTMRLPPPPDWSGLGHHRLILARAR